MQLNEGFTRGFCDKQGFALDGAATGSLSNPRSFPKTLPMMKQHVK